MTAGKPEDAGTFAVTLVRGRVEPRLAGAPLPGLDGCSLDALPHVAASLGGRRLDPAQ